MMCGVISSEPSVTRLGFDPGTSCMLIENVSPEPR